MKREKRPGLGLMLILALALGLPAWVGRAEAPSVKEEPSPAPKARVPEQPAPPAELTQEEKDDLDAAYNYLQTLTEAMLQIKKRYVEEKTYKQIIYGALHGMLEGLDPHSAFMDQQQYTEMQDDTAGKFSGVGIHLGVKNGALIVIAPIEDSPGFRAGLQSGDFILEVNGEKTSQMTIEEAIKKMRGAKGTKVTLKIQSLGSDEPRKVEIVRDEIVVPNVKGTRILRNGIGYVRITQFEATTADSLQQALDELNRNHMTALVLDLRSNPGGLLVSAIDVAQKFLKEGDLIVATQGRKGTADRVENHAAGPVHYRGFPIAVLVNGGSASASEIVAGALQDHKRAFLVGDTTFGKGSVQSLIPLGTDRKTALRLTVAYYYTPSGRLIHEKGLDPDVPVYVSPEEWRKVQIRRAHLEEPKLFTETELKQYSDVEDQVLNRAADLLQAIRLLK
jgi:carboxyl-terminal processing protease